MWGTDESPASSLPHPAMARPPATARPKATWRRWKRGARANTGTISHSRPRAGKSVAHMAG